MNSIDTRKASESIAEAQPVPAKAGSGLLDAVDMLFMVNLLGAANFCACLLKPLERSYGYALRGFHEHSSKICDAQDL